MHLATADVNQHTQRFIKYRHDLAQRYHCPILSLMINQFEFWFKKQRDKKAKFPNSDKIEANVFYKFISPPNKHHLYRKGDSWTEELCITADVFRLHFKKIGVLYKSLSLFKQAQENGDVFQGKRYASYYNRLRRQVFFIKNMAYDDVLDFGVNDKDKRDFSVISKPKRKFEKKSVQTSSQNQGLDEDPITAPVPSSTPQSIDAQMDTDIDTNVDQSISYHSTIDIGSALSNSPILDQDNKNNVDENITTTDCNNDDNTLSVLPTQSRSATAKNVTYKVSRKPCLTSSNVRDRNNYFQRKHSISLSFKEKESINRFMSQENMANKMIAIWQTRVGETKLNYISAKLLIELQDILKDYFENSLLHWEEYCQKIASSKFLMGEGKAWTFKGSIYLIWAIKPENINKLQKNMISTGDRERPSSADERAIKQQFVNIISEIEEVKRQQESLPAQVCHTWRWAVQDQVNDILQGNDNQQLEHYQQQFEQMIQSGDKDDITWSYARCAQNFNIEKWRHMSRTIGSTDNPWWHFEVYVRDILASRYFGQNKQQILKERQHAIEDQLKQLYEQVIQLNQKRGLN